MTSDMETQRQNLIGTAGNIITGQAQLDEMRDKVPVEIGGRTFNVKPSEAAKMEYDKMVMNESIRQFGVEKTLGVLEHMRKTASDADTRKYIDAQIEDIRGRGDLRDAQERHHAGS